MQLQVTQIPDSPLGTTVELRELTMDGFLAAQKAVVDPSDTMEISMQYLSRMLYIDGVSMTREALGQYGMTQILPLIRRMNEMFPESEEGEG
jgi:hypothetical protein